MGSVNIKDIARMCGVGVSTVSRALNDHPDINQATKEKIMRCIEENNYIPNNSARNLKRQEAKVIAILVKGLSNMFLISMTKLLEAEINKRGYSVALERIKFEEDEVDIALELVKEKRLKGIIFLGGDFEHRVDKLKELDVPFVLSTAGSKPDPINKENYSSVSVDDIHEAYRMTDYLCKKGHKRVAMLSAKSDDKSVGYWRLEGYKQALKDNGIKFDKNLVIYMRPDIEDYSMKNGYVVTKEFLEKGVDCSAIFAISDTLAIGCTRAILESGRSVPGDIAVAGFDGVEASEFYYPSITTISQPAEEMATATAKILFDIIKGKGGHQHLIFEAELIERESTNGK
ncbi:MAG: LacI family transcriptional regulator [Lachnospiraceae bacterium]|nr:LacI family transcriptional regulator [Lachnospiraceae bacterium]